MAKSGWCLTGQHEFDGEPGYCPRHFSSSTCDCRCHTDLTWADAHRRPPHDPGAGLLELLDDEDDSEVPQPR